MNDGGPIRLSEFLRRDLIRLPLDAADTEEAISELVRTLALGGEIPSSRIDDITARAILNERRHPTGIKNGLALPNCVGGALVRTSAALGISREGVDFRCLDGESAHAILLFVCPESSYKKVLLGLEAVATLFEETRLSEDIVTQSDPAEVLRLIEDAETDELLSEERY